MALAEGYRKVALTPDQWDDIVDIDEWAFLNPWLPEDREHQYAAFPWGRGSGIAIADAKHGPPGSLVAVRCSHEFTMVVPGGARVPTSGLSWVGVHPGHRRRGLLSAMISEHFEHALERGEIISALTASEPKIYQRFGYGLATWHLRAKFGRGAELRQVEGAEKLSVRLERLDLDAHAQLISELQLRVDRPGSIAREGEAIAADLFTSNGDLRPQEERLRIAIVSNEDGEPQAFGVFRRKPGPETEYASGEVTVKEFATTSAASARRLWEVIFDLDLTASATVTSLATDDPLLWLALDQRAPKAVVEDDLWLRILDLPRALAARTYDAPIDLAVMVRDDQIGYNTGLWRLATEPTDPATPPSPSSPAGPFTLTATRIVDGLADGTAAPDLSMRIQELSALYLGGVSAQALTDAGLVTELTPGASLLLSLAMRSARTPMSNFHF